MNKSRILTFVIVLVVAALTLGGVVYAAESFERDCEKKGGHVENDVYLFTGPVYDPTLKKVVVKTTTHTTSWCESRDGRHIHV